MIFNNKKNNKVKCLRKRFWQNKYGIDYYFVCREWKESDNSCCVLYCDCSVLFVLWMFSVIKLSILNYFIIMYYAPSKTQNYLIIYYYVVWAKVIFNNITSRLLLKELK